MTDRELMQQALEALEQSRVFVTTREKIKHPEGTDWYDERIAALRERLAQPELEPVAWLVQYKNKHEIAWGRKPQWVTEDVLGIEPLYTAQQHQQELEELMIWKSRALQAEGIIDKFLKSEQSSVNEILNSTTNRNTLSCGCKSPYLGFPSEWDTHTREGDNAVAYGVLCEQHFYEYDARPAQKGS